MSDDRPQSTLEHNDLTHVKVMICSDSKCDKNGMAFPVRRDVGVTHWVRTNDAYMYHRPHEGAVVTKRVEVEIPRFEDVVSTLLDVLATVIGEYLSDATAMFQVREQDGDVYVIFVGENSEIMREFHGTGYLMDLLYSYPGGYVYKVTARIVDMESLRNLGGCDV